MFLSFLAKLKYFQTHKCSVFALLTLTKTLKLGTSGEESFLNLYDIQIY